MNLKPMKLEDITWTTENNTRNSGIHNRVRKTESAGV